METHELEVVGGEHDFNVFDGERLIAEVWHSDKGEWSVATPDGPVYRERSRAAAIERCEKLAS